MPRIKQKMKAFKRMKTTVAIIALIALALLLSGCAADSSLMEEQKNLVVSCLNDHDSDGLQAIMYPNDLSKEELEAGYQAIADIWRPVDAKDVKLIQFSGQTNAEQKIYQGIYQFPKEMEQYALYLSYVETDGVKGLTNIRIISASQAQPPAAR